MKIKKDNNKRHPAGWIVTLILFLVLASFCTGCGGQETSGDPSGSTGTDNTVITETAAEGESDSGGGNVPDRDGVYDSKDDVAAYLHTYHQLPKNYITKEEARALGWEGGPLEEYAPGKCIGGDHFGNYEKLLPKDSYHECDINTLGKARGAERIIFSEDDIYYTPDHYQTFEHLYDANGKL